MIYGKFDYYDSVDKDCSLVVEDDQDGNICIFRVACGEKTPLIEMCPDQWGTWIYHSNLVVAYEHGTKSYLAALISALKTLETTCIPS